MQKNKTEFLILLLGWLMMLSSAQGASFDCAKASTRVEHLICGNAELSKLDDDLSAAYSKTLKKSSAPAILKQKQRNWLVERNGCLDSDCVESAYRSQIGELTGEPKVGKLLTLLSKNEKLCGDYKNYIEHEVATKRQYGHMAVPMCERPFSSDYPEFTPVKWREVSPEDYPELAVQAYRYIHYWPWSRSQIAYYLSDDAFKNQLDAIKLNYSFKWWHMWLGEADINNSGDKETLLRVEADGRCGDISDKPKMWVLPVMVVDKSGKGIDTEKTGEVLGIAMLPDIPQFKNPGILAVGLNAFDVFNYSKQTFYGRLENEWTYDSTGNYSQKSYMPDESALTIYQISNNETKTVCRFKFRKTAD